MGKDYVVPPSEGLWWATSMQDFRAGNRDKWKWTMMIFTPDWITKNFFNEAIEFTKKKKLELSKSLSKISKVSKPISRVSLMKSWSDIYKPSKVSKISKVLKVSKPISYKPPSKQPYKPKPIRKIIPPIFKLPRLALPKPRRRIVKRKPRRIIRRPSLWALAEKITAPKIRKFEPSGLIMRPIISKRKRKGRRVSPLFRRTLDIDFWKKKKKKRK